MALGDGERRICDAVAERRDELVALASELIGFDTTARTVGEPPRQEVALQEYLAGGCARPERRSTCGSPTRIRSPASRSCRRGSTSPDGRS